MSNTTKLLKIVDITDSDKGKFYDIYFHYVNTGKTNNFTGDRVRFDKTDINGNKEFTGRYRTKVGIHKIQPLLVDPEGNRKYDNDFYRSMQNYDPVTYRFKLADPQSFLVPYYDDNTDSEGDS